MLLGVDVNFMLFINVLSVVVLDIDVLIDGLIMVVIVYYVLLLIFVGWRVV